MKSQFRRAALFAMLALPLVAGPSFADDQDAIDYRQHIMKTLNEQSAILGQILSGAAPGDNTAIHLDILALTAQTALKSFEPKAPGGEAKPDVWAHWDDFSKRMKDFAQKTSELSKLAKEKGKDAALSGLVSALSCKGCHDVYRNENKK